MGSLRRCELCCNGASLHCEADSAYLCWGCDAKVHGANFLVARHVRIVLCCRCHEYTDISICALCPDLDQCLCSGCLKSECSDETSLRISTTESGISGRGFCSPCKTTKDGVIASGLKNCFCTEDKEDHRLLEASTNRVLKVSIDELSWSYSEHATSLDSQSKGQQKNHMITRHAVVVQYSDMKVEAILRRWYRYLNLRNTSTVPLAMHLVEKGSHKLGILFRKRWRICVAAALWLAASLCEKKAHLPSMKKVEECTGVPSKLILAVESRLAKISDWKKHEEGCAESDTVSPS